VGHFLETGERATPDEWKAIASAGRASASARISLADMTKLYLCWRDVVLEAVRAHAHLVAIDPRSLQLAEETVRVGCDASLVRTAKEFDIRRHQLQVQLADEQARLAHLARHDALTGLPNRHTLFEQLGTVVEACHRGGHAVAVLFVDLDQFKAVNDRAGHSTGDELLRGVAERLAGVTRPEDMVARLGGDEFVVLCSGLRVEDAQLEAERVADRIHAALLEPFVIKGVDLRTSASIGLSVVRPGDDPERLLSKADAAMYVAKHARLPVGL
jgi:diguanylate cyclase (GGDEF)-like protein